jgi:peptidyl-prolyl cis-trans isomerase D
MRKMASGFVAKLLMLFLVVSFGIWGISDVFRETGANYAATVGSATISGGAFAKQKALITRRAEALGLKDLNPSALDGAILRQLIQQKLVNLTMQDLGLYVSQSLLAQMLREEPAFQNKDGSFNKDAFAHMLREQRISERDLLSQVQDEAETKFLLSSLDASDLGYPDSVRALNATAALETRDAWIVTIAPSNAPTIIDEATLKAFYEQNKSILYVKPESRALEYVVLRPQQLEAAIDSSITDAMRAEAKKQQPQASAQEIKERLRKEQREKAMHALEASLDDALAGGATLSEALSKANLSAPIHTLNDVSDKDPKTTEDDVLKTVINQGFQMGDGETSGLILSQNGTPLIVHVKSLTIAGAQDYAAVASDVHDRVAEKMRGDAARARVQEVKEALGKITGDSAHVTEPQLQAALAPFNLRAREAKGLSRPQATMSA